MEELIEVLLPRTELTISVKRNRGEILIPIKLSEAMNLNEGDIIIPLKNRCGDIYIKKLTTACDKGLKCHKRSGYKEKRLAIYSRDVSNMILEPDDNRGLYLVDKQVYNGEEVYFICTKNNYHDRTTKYKAKRDNEASGRQNE